MSRILAPGRNVSGLAPVTHAGVLVDACDYYRAFYQAMCGARRYALLAGWQFDSDVRLLRGDDALGAPYPIELLPFLEALSRERPSLEIYVLAWDYSVVYTLEREWMQRLKFDFGTVDRIRYLLDGKHPLGASHHQKLVAIDGRLAFVGGADICDGRWDDRRHERTNAERVNRYGDPYKPYHEVVGYLTGSEAVARLEGDFCDRWERASGVPLRLERPARTPARSDDAPPAFAGALPIASDAVAIARTYPAYESDGSAAVREIALLYEDAIRDSEALVYIETQYITSRALHEALVARMRDESKPSLAVVIVLPRGSDTLKEHLALGAAEDQLLASIAEVARDTGHFLRVLYSAASDGSRDGRDEPEPPATYIHAKLLVVDDRFMTLGSANCTNRSFCIDSELNLAWECERPEEPLGKSISRFRASLLSEHAGVPHDEGFERIDGLVEHIDAVLRSGTRLRLRPLREVADADDAPPLLTLAFDPEGPLLERALEELFGQRAEPRGATS